MLCVDGACRTMGLNDWGEGLVKGVWAREYERGVIVLMIRAMVRGSCK